jgi:type I restriction enzyme S subunit
MSHNYFLSEGDIVFARTGASVGKSYLYKADDGQLVYAGFLIRVRPHPEKLLPAFAAAYTRTGSYWRWVRLMSMRSGQPGINGKEYADLPIPLPPLPEQRAITAALSDVDALLDGLDRLIAKKRDLKQAAMQQLLTGQTRLPGFHDEWDVRRLEELGTFLKGSGVKKDEAGSGDLPCIRYGEIYTHHENYIRSFNSWISRTVADTATPLRRGDILFATSGETKEEIGKCVAFLDDREAYAGGDIVIMRPTGADSMFLGYILNTAAIARQKASRGQGDAVVHISAKALSSIVLSVPSIDEQSAIANVLSDMDAELSALEARRDKSRNLKEAVMQELLTGRTRLIQPELKLEKGNSAQPGQRPANIHFRRIVLAAEIIDRLHEEPTFGHVKLQKMIFLVEHLCDVNTGSSYHRDAAGPYDNRAMRSIDSQLLKQNWFEVQKTERRYRYVPMASRGGHGKYFDRYFAGIRPKLDDILSTFRTFDTTSCEIVATLFGAWNDLALQGKAVSDDAILHEVLNNWHESKKRIPKERWLKALAWMRKKGFTPAQGHDA